MRLPFAPVPTARISSPERRVVAAVSLAVPYSHAHASGFSVVFPGFDSLWVAGVVGSGWQMQFGSPLSLFGAVAASAGLFADLLSDDPHRSRLVVRSDVPVVTEFTSLRFHKVAELPDPQAVNQQLIVLNHRSAVFHHAPDDEAVRLAADHAARVAASFSAGVSTPLCGPLGGFFLGGRWRFAGDDWVVVFADASICDGAVRVGWHAGGLGLYSGSRPGWPAVPFEAELRNVAEILETWPHAARPLVVTDNVLAAHLAGFDAFWTARRLSRFDETLSHPLLARLRRLVDRTGAVVTRQPGHAGLPGMSLAHQLARGSLFTSAPAPGGWGSQPVEWFHVDDPRPSYKVVGPNPARARWPLLYLP